MTLSTSTVTLAPGSSRTYTLAPGEAVTVATKPNCYVTVTETPEVITTADQGGQTNVRESILQYKGTFTYGPYALGGTVAVAVSLSKSTSSVAVTLGSAAAAVVSAAGGVPIILAQSGIPFVMPSSGSVASNGYLSGLTAFNTVYGWCYCYFPAGAVFSGSAAGWYLTNLTGATVGTIYADTYSSGQPKIPDSPTPITAAGPGAYTQATGADVPGPSCIVPAGALGPNGALYWERATNNNNSAGSKVYNTYLGATVLTGATQTTNPYHGALGTLKNRGSAQRQFCLNSQNGDPGNAGGMKYLTLDTNQAQVFAHSIRINTATDFAVIESFAFYYRPN